MIARNAFDYTVDRILRRRCVPVLRIAGISMTSKPRSGEWVHNVKWMVTTLKKSCLSFDSLDIKLKLMELYASAGARMNSKLLVIKLLVIFAKVCVFL